MPPNDIIGREKELLACADAPNLYNGQRCYEIQETEFKSIAQALLDRDEKLKIAEEALETISRETVGGCEEDVIADNALSRIRSLKAS